MLFELLWGTGDAAGLAAAPCTKIYLQKEKVAVTLTLKYSE
jgi:hypothetical protein